MREPLSGAAVVTEQRVGATYKYPPQLNSACSRDMMSYQFLEMAAGSLPTFYYRAACNADAV